MATLLTQNPRVVLSEGDNCCFNDLGQTSSAIVQGDALNPDPSSSTAMTRCFTCDLKVPTDSDGKILKHERKTGVQCTENAPYADPAAQFIGWGLAFVLIAFLPFVIGIANALSSPYGDGGTGWFVFAGLLEITGVISLCIGIYRLARKADIAFLITHDRYDASRAQLVRERGTAAD